jgi:phosphogluconate dehydratase
VYPNGQADVNHLHAAGGTSCLFRQLLNGGYLHAEAKTAWGDSFADFVQEPVLEGGELLWKQSPETPLDTDVLASIDQPFSEEGGLRLLTGNLGRSVIKVSAVSPEHRIVEAPAIVLECQDDITDLFETGQLEKDCVVVVRFQGPAALGMPELHKLTPYLGTLQDRGFKVALVTDGRMSGASGKVPAAIHLIPEAACGGLLAKLVNGDIIRVDAEAGTLSFCGDIKELESRQAAEVPGSGELGCGRELFAVNRQAVNNAEHGASFLYGEF